MEIKDGVEYISQAKDLIVEYTQGLNRDLTFQGIDDELADPKKKYAPPEGELLVAVEDDVVLGVVAYHRHSASRCEMKRLYVKPDVRGLHIGEKLILEIIRHAKTAGYSEMVLDTLKPMQEAIHLYRRFGFRECEPYYNNPMDDVIYMKKELLEINYEDIS